MPFDPFVALNAMIRAEVRRSSDTGPSPIAQRTPEAVPRPSVERRAERLRAEHPDGDRSGPVRRAASEPGRDQG
ncbi:hypothetical protein [Streptomyces cremeus]|uniref:Uncharacterized protein n=1 Tax=Streptomyces cremeus TaxID=66881 RepID=A0ABV5P7M6_STRCM